MVHQACGLQAAGERITFVNGFSFADPAISYFTASCNVPAPSWIWP